MLYKRVLHKAFSRIPDITTEEVDLVVDSVIHENEHSLEDAMKDTATKDDIRDIESRMATKDDIKYIESSMATQADLAKLEAKLTTTLCFLFCIVGIILACIGLVLTVYYYSLLDLRGL